MVMGSNVSVENSSHCFKEIVEPVNLFPIEMGVEEFKRSLDILEQNKKIAQKKRK